MQLQGLAVIVILAQLASCIPFLEGRDTCQTNDLNLPSGGMRGYNGIRWGFAPDDGAGTSMSKINGDTGKRASTYGRYSQIRSSSIYHGTQLLSVMDDVVASGAVLVASIMPTGLTFSEISTSIANDIVNVLNKFTNEGVEVWLRFAHEVNYYVTPGSGGPDDGPMYPGGTQTEFIAAWRRVHDAVASNPKILMFWSPNEPSEGASIASLQSWFPGTDYIDIVGIDVYPAAEPAPTFASVYGDFYDLFAKAYNKHFCIGETGVAHGGSIAAREEWVKHLANSADVSAYPCFKSATWFEFDKGVDFRVVEGQSKVTVGETLSNFV